MGNIEQRDYKVLGGDEFGNINRRQIVGYPNHRLKQLRCCSKAIRGIRVLEAENDLLGWNRE